MRPALTATGPYRLLRCLSVLNALALAAAPTAARALDFSLEASTAAWTDKADDGGPGGPSLLRARAGGELAGSGVRVQFEALAGNRTYFAQPRDALVREAWVDLPLADTRLRLGRQIVRWGRADQISPTDSFAVRDWQWRTPELDDQRLGTTGAEWTIPFGAFTVSALWMPWMQSSRLPFAAALARLPADTIDGAGNAGLRLDRSGRALDWGLSVYEGADLSPSLQGADTGGLLPRLSWRNDRITRLGADFAAVLGHSTLRGELAHTRSHAAAGLADVRLPGVRVDQVAAALGADRDLGAGLDLNLQLMFQHLLASPLAFAHGADDFITRRIVRAQALVNQQPVRNLVGFGARLQQRLAGERLRLELAGLVYGAGQGATVRVRLLWQVDDALTLVLGANRYTGGPDSLLGLLDSHDAVFVQLRYAL